MALLNIAEAMPLSKRTAPASTHRAYLLVSVSFVPAAGAFAMYTVAASVVVTFELLAARVGCWKATPAKEAAVPDPAVFVSVNVAATTLMCFPVVFGVPDLAPGVRFKACDAELLI